MRHHPRDGRPETLSPRNQQKARTLGLTSAAGLVIGSIIGTGVFTMPAVLAAAGTSSLVVWRSSRSARPCWPRCSAS
jgi:basic amino acid/polyamine antiporter, APA family